MSSKGSAGVLGSTQPPGGSLKSSISSGALSSGWSIGSKQEVRFVSCSCLKASTCSELCYTCDCQFPSAAQRRPAHTPKTPACFLDAQAHTPPARVPSAKNLQEAAGRGSSPLTVAPRVPSAHRLNPLGSPQRNASSPLPSGPSQNKQQASADDDDLSNLSTEELRQLTMSLHKETTALRNHLEAISGTGNPISKGGAAAAPVPPAGVPASESPRKSGVSFAPAHRNSVLVVDFQRPSVVSHPTDAMK